MATNGDVFSQKSRKKNYSEEETRTLLHEILMERKLLMGSSSGPQQSMKKKAEVWRTIAEQVNAIGGMGRTAEELKKKWKDLKGAAIRYRSDMKKTGGGPPPRPPPYLDLIEAILGSQSTIATGIEVEGTDSYVFVKNETGNHSLSPDNGNGIEIYLQEDGFEGNGLVDTVQPIILEVPPPPSTEVKGKDKVDFVATQATGGKIESDLTSRWMESEIAKNEKKIMLMTAQMELIELQKQEILQNKK